MTDRLFHTPASHGGAKQDQDVRSVLIVAHGERGGQNDNSKILTIAEEVRAKLCEGGAQVEIEVGVLKGSPSIAKGWQALSATQRFIYPFFMSDGFFYSRILPKKVSEAVGLPKGQLTILPPFGTSPSLATGIASSIRRDLHSLGRAGEKPPITLVAHGASVDRQSNIRAQALADELRAMGQFGPIFCAFLDEAPFLRDMAPSLHPDSIIVPHFNGLGAHSVDDMDKFRRLMPETCHFVTPVGAQDWVADAIAQDLAGILGLECALPAVAAE